MIINTITIVQKYCDIVYEVSSDPTPFTFLHNMGDTQTINVIFGKLEEDGYDFGCLKQWHTYACENIDTYKEEVYDAFKQLQIKEITE